MIRIGRVICCETNDRSRPYFRLVIENGKLVLGCWRSLGYESLVYDQTVNPRVIFERVS
jgi:hypothetical protein